MQIFAAAAATAHLTVADKLRQIPFEFWWKMALGVVAVIAVVVVLRKVAKVNKVFLGVGVGLVSTIVGFNWLKHGSESDYYKALEKTIDWVNRK